jgi:uncharacterized protein YegP (UPF0339 family)
VYFVLFEGTDHHWYWKLTDKAGQISAIGSSGYATQAEAVQAIQRVKGTTPATPVCDWSGFTIFGA